MILKQKAFQELVQIMKLKKNQEKNVTYQYRTRMHNKNSACMERNSPTQKPFGYLAVDITERYITCTVQVTQTSWLRQNNNENFCKITKICLLETK